MEQLIRFRLMADSLSQNEFSTFLQTLNIDGRSLILKGLSYLFRAQIKNKSNSSDLAKATNIVSTILDSRNSKQLQEIESKKQFKPFSLDDLPYPIVGKCASYLQFIDYQSLQKVSRSIFIACNDPITLTKIDKKIFVKIYESNQHLKLVKYQKVKHFEIDVNPFCKMTSIHNLSLSKCIKSLQLYFSTTAAINQLLNTKCIDFAGIEMLKLDIYYFDFPSVKLHVVVFCNLLKQLKNIKFLQLNCSILKANGFDAIFDNKQFRKKIFNKLEGLSLGLYKNKGDLVDFYDHLLHYFSNKLLSLHFYGNIKCPINGYPNLKELCISHANYIKINNVLKTAKKLERIHLGFESNNIENENKLQKVLMELLHQNTLELISIIIDKDIPKIRNVLQKISFPKRKRLKIRFHISGVIDNVNEYYEILKSKFRGNRDIENWMILFKFRFVETMAKYVPSEKKYVIGNTMTLCASSEQCKINGYRERWLHSCICN